MTLKLERRPGVALPDEVLAIVAALRHARDVLIDHHAFDRACPTCREIDAILARHGGDAQTHERPPPPEG